MTFPVLVRAGNAASGTTNSTSWAPTWAWNTNTAIAAGERVVWVAIVASDGFPTLTATGWGKQGQTSSGAVNSSSTTIGIFTQETTGAYAAGATPALTVTSSGSEQFTASLLAFKVSSGSTVGFFLSSGAFDNVSAAVDFAAVTNGSGGSLDAYVVAAASVDGQNLPSPAPTGYTGLTSQLPAGTAGATAFAAGKQITLANGATEDPGTSALAAAVDWASYTFVVYEITPVSSPQVSKLNFGVVTGPAKLAVSKMNFGAVTGPGSLAVSKVNFGVVISTIARNRRRQVIN